MKDAERRRPSLTTPFAFEEVCSSREREVLVRGRLKEVRVGLGGDMDEW